MRSRSSKKVLLKTSQSAYVTLGCVSGPSQVTLAGLSIAPTARAGNRRFGRLSALRAHTKAPYKMNFHRKTPRNAKGA